jgi:S1-C subfamily serine protease
MKNTVRTIALSGALFSFLFLTDPHPAHALPDTVLDSVVAVVPDLPMRERMEEPEGSGIVIFSGGYVATAAHVMGRARTARLKLQDGRQITAELAGIDPPSDIALLKVSEDLPVIAFGEKPGLADPVCAIGNPFGLGNSVSCGVVSALDRTATGFNPVEDFIQTDAAVNPGMSGGALVTPDGRLAGIVTAIFTKQSDGDIGVNFASSLALLLRVTEDLRDHGKVIRAPFPFRVQPLSADQAALQAGVRVSASPGNDVRTGDIITAIDDRRVRRVEDVTSAIGLRRPGETIRISLVRNGSSQTVTISLAGKNKVE